MSRLWPILDFCNGIACLALFMLPLLQSSAFAAVNAPLSEQEKIQSLITGLGNLKDAVFIRNGASYDAKAAMKFLKGKWQSKESEIKTAKDFIEKVASQSSTTGKPYVIRFKDAHEINCGDYLRDELKKIEQSKPSISK